MHVIYSNNMKRENQKVKKVVSKKSVARDSHTEEIKRYISEVSKDAEKRTNIHLGALTENFKHQVSAVAEQFLGLNEKVDSLAENLEGKIDAINIKLDTHTLILNEHGKILGEHGNMLKEHGNMLKDHSEMIGRLMTDSTEIKENLKEKISQEQFNKLEMRLVSLEKFVFTERGTTKNKANR